MTAIVATSGWTQHVTRQRRRVTAVTGHTPSCRRRSRRGARRSGGSAQRRMAGDRPHPTADGAHGGGGAPRAWRRRSGGGGGGGRDTAASWPAATGRRRGGGATFAPPRQRGGWHAHLGHPGPDPGPDPASPVRARPCARGGGSDAGQPLGEQRGGVTHPHRASPHPEQCAVTPSTTATFSSSLGGALALGGGSRAPAEQGVVGALRGGDVVDVRWVWSGGGRSQQFATQSKHGGHLLCHRASQRGGRRPIRPQRQRPQNATDNPRQPPAARHCAAVGPRTTRAPRGRAWRGFLFGGRSGQPAAAEPRRHVVEKAGIGRGTPRAVRPVGRADQRSSAWAPPGGLAPSRRAPLSARGGDAAQDNQKLRRALVCGHSLAGATTRYGCVGVGAPRTGHPVREIVAEPLSCVQSFAPLGHSRRFARRVQGHF